MKDQVKDRVVGGWRRRRGRGVVPYRGILDCRIVESGRLHFWSASVQYRWPALSLVPTHPNGETLRNSTQGSFQRNMEPSEHLVQSRSSLFQGPNIRISCGERFIQTPSTPNYSTSEASLFTICRITVEMNHRVIVASVPGRGLAPGHQCAWVWEGGRFSPGGGHTLCCPRDVYVCWSLHVKSRISIETRIFMIAVQNETAM